MNKARRNSGFIFLSIFIEKVTYWKASGTYLKAEIVDLP